MADEAARPAGELEGLRRDNLLLKGRVKRLLEWVGDKGECRGPRCRREIYWIAASTKGLPAGVPRKKMPVDPDGTPHHATCPDAKKFGGK